MTNNTPLHESGIVTREVAYRLIDEMPEDYRITDPERGSYINPDRIEDLASDLQDFIACVIATLIDAGSERDAVNESEALHTTLITELKGWT